VKRRAFLGTLAAAVLTPRASTARQSRTTFRIGFLSSFPLPPEGRTPLTDALESGLRDLGYAVGSSLVIERSSPIVWAGQEAELAARAAELIALRVDVIVAVWNPAIVAVQRAATPIPVVMVGAVDPVGHGFVASLSRSGTNMTGLTWDIGIARQLEVLREVIPTLSSVAVLREPAVGWGSTYWREAEVAALRLGIRLLSVEVHSPDDFDSAFRAIGQGRVDALVLLASQLVWRSSGLIMSFARENRLPVLAPRKHFAEAGAIISYAVDDRALFRQAAGYVHKLLQGRKPADLPVERPVVLELVVNKSAAKALGLTIPHSLLGWADDVIDP
jgi:putative ABC transport system substrate-binding protein